MALIFVILFSSWKHCSNITVNYDAYLDAYSPMVTDHHSEDASRDNHPNVSTDAEVKRIRHGASVVDASNEKFDNELSKGDSTKNYTGIEPKSSSNATREEPLVLSKSGPSNKQCIISVHIPKSGGSTLDARLNKNLLRDKFGYVTYLKKSRERPLRPSPSLSVDFFNHTIVNEHITPRFWREQLPKGLRCYRFTMLREPVDRVQSAFYYHGHADQDWSDCLNTTSEMGSDLCHNWPAYQNDMVRQLSGIPKAWSVYETRYATLVRSDDTRYLEAAKQTLLQDIDRVCFLEDGISACVRSVLEDLGLLKRPENDTNNNSTTYFNQTQERQQDTAVVVNKGSTRPQDRHIESDKDMNLLDSIRRANSLDIQLYDFAREAFGDSTNRLTSKR